MKLIEDVWTKCYRFNPRDRTPDNPERLVRVFKHSPGMVVVQIWSRGKISDFGTDKHECYSVAILSVEQLNQLISALQHEFWGENKGMEDD